MKTSLTMAHLVCAASPTSRLVWVRHQCSVALALPAFPVGASPLRDDARGGTQLAAAYAALERGLPSGGAGCQGLVVELELPEALALVRAHGRPLLDAVRRTGSFLYRGEPLGQGEGGGGPRAVVETPDLFDEETYGSPLAAEYFRASDSLMAENFGATARPSNAHIMVSNQEAASAWGTACSVWPLGDSLDYSWFDNCSELWNPSWGRPGSRSSVANGNREAFFWRDKDSLGRFFAAGLRVNSGLPSAIRSGHEILVRSGGFSVGSNAGRGGGHVIQDALVCIPASEDELVRSVLGIPPDSARV
ncbi:unnamed protein product [Laminaria digitata]